MSKYDPPIYVSFLNRNLLLMRDSKIYDRMPKIHQIILQEYNKGGDFFNDILRVFGPLTKFINDDLGKVQKEHGDLRNYFLSDNVLLTKLYKQVQPKLHLRHIA